MKLTKPVSIYDYTDYRQFLHDYYEEQKASNPVFSYRYFARKAGFNSSGLYKDIVDGRTGITRSLILRFAAAMKLGKRQTEYFETIVYFNEAKSIEEKKHYFERLLRFYESKVRRVDEAQYEYFSNWYYPLIRELCAIGKCTEDFAAITRSIRPRIRTDQAKKAVETLLKLGLIRKESDGRFRPVDKVLSTGPEVKSLAVATFQKTMIKLGAEAIERFPARQRNISSVTFSVSESAFNDISAEIDACRKRILAMVERCEKEDRVCQLNIQLFPLSHIGENNEKT